MFRITHYQEIDSTSDELIRLAKNNAPEGTVISADKQNKGRGQENRNWDSEKGGLYFSLLLRPELLFPLLTLMTGIVAVETLKEFSGLDFKLKWPNDVLFEKNKISGILTESFYSGNKPEFVVIGCGINLNQTHFPELEGNTPVSLQMLTGKTIEPEIFLDNFLERFTEYYRNYKEGNYSYIIDKYRTYSCLINKKVQIKVYGDRVIEGIVTGINSDGAIILDCNGKTETIISGRIIEF